MGYRYIYMVVFLYGLPKIHKDEVLLRSIVSTINSPTYPLPEHRLESKLNSSKGNKLVGEFDFIVVNYSITTVQDS